MLKVSSNCMVYWGGKIIENLQVMVVHLCTDLLIYDIHRVDMEEIEEQEAHGQHRSPEKMVQINKRIWFYHNTD